MLEGKTILVTGAAHGIGAATARHAARAGARVALGDIDGEALEQVAGAIAAEGGEAVASVTDVRQWDAAADLVEGCVAAFGRIDGLVSCAGTFHIADPWAETEEQVRALVETDLLGTIACGTHALRFMKERRTGVVLTMTSSAQCGEATEAVYAAVKGGLASLTYSWALAMRPFGVRANAVAATGNTRMLDVTRKHRPTTVTWPPDQMAPLITFLLSDLANEITGQVIRLWDRQLSVMTHPSLAQPALEQPTPWTVEDLEDVFAAELADQVRQQPGGWRSVPVVDRSPRP